MIEQISTEGLIQPGSTCWRSVHVDRFALIVDAAEYFAQLKAAMILARKRIMLIVWDFDTRVRLEPEVNSGIWPDKFGSFISTLVERRPDLQVYLLKWDLGILKTLGRGATPLFILNWMTGKRIHLRLDSVHPLGACHHQKVAVIDDALAFCGGIDLTVGRWDTPEHRDEDLRRASPWGFAQSPWHDATAAVDGEAAQSLAELARERWESATGERLPPLSERHAIWPQTLQTTFHDVNVGIARTQPKSDGQTEVREVEALTLAAIARAHRFIYVESQYLASHRIADALAKRLGETSGPEVIVINPLSTEGWLEDEVMGSARARIIDVLRGTTGGSRFRIYHPVAAGGTPIYVHAKLMIVDDRFLKIGSANMNNRSMGLDTECDLAVDTHDQTRSRALRIAICGIRHRLLAEHLCVTAEEFARVELEEGSLVRAIDRLRVAKGRTLVPLEPRPLNAVEEFIAGDGVLDPDRPEPIVNQLAKLASASARAWRGSSSP
ncbi:phospholipase D-like domain-containing protein [Methylobacterium oryzisoli]|uniref:phospholipase D-like domain-containing protein n=1 Tax=Methylobacterium oryzisoli TaxID=3385502 RepID=UPI00389134B8